MNTNYWRVVNIDSEEPADERRVMLHGELDEIVGPMSMELAAAWMERFNEPGVVKSETQIVSVTIKRHRLRGKKQASVDKKRQESAELVR